MRRALYVILAVVLIAIAFWLGWFYADQNRVQVTPTTNQPDTTQTQPTDTTETEDVTTEYTSEKGVKVVVTDPQRNGVIESPLRVIGTVPGNWSFEGSFPVKILDADRNVVAESPATLDGDWMTEDMVPFTANVTFTAPATDTGYLVLERSNASDLEENDDRVEIPIRFVTE